MTTAHRPTWHTALGGEGQGGNRLATATTKVPFAVFFFDPLWAETHTEVYSFNGEDGEGVLCIDCGATGDM